jgi:hypothetical protein
MITSPALECGGLAPLWSRAERALRELKFLLTQQAPAGNHRSRGRGMKLRGGIDDY